MAGLSALLLGATSAAGSLLLQEVLTSPVFDRVGEYGRRVTHAEKIRFGMDKLEQKVIDYDDIEKMGLREGRWDVVFITYVPHLYCDSARGPTSRSSLGLSVTLAESTEEFE